MDNKATVRRGIAEQFNYTKTYIGLDKVIVHIPGGFHLESFDQKEKRIGLRSLFLLFDSTIHFAIWPAQDNKSFLDLHKMPGDISIFTSYSSCEIDQSFYKVSSPKWPLDATLSLTHVGPKSYTISISLQSPRLLKPYATLVCVSVFVSKEARKPCPAPAWWKNIYSNLVLPNIPSRMKPLLRPSSCSRIALTTYHSDTDDNQHTSWTTYIRACYDAFMDGAMRNSYSTITAEDATKGVFTFEIRFLKESSMCDTLDAYSWEISRHLNKGLGFEIKKGSDVCCQAVMKFHTHMVDEIPNSRL